MQDSFSLKRLNIILTLILKLNLIICVCVTQLLEVNSELLTQLLSSLEDDNKNTRLVVCRVLMHVFLTLRDSIDQDRLHNMYPDLLKRLDDSSDDIRSECGKVYHYPMYEDCPLIACTVMWLCICISISFNRHCQLHEIMICLSSCILA